jgi:hypothetical protein
MARVGSRRENGLQGDFGEAWLEAVAAGSGLLHGRPTSLDYQKADVQLVFPVETPDTYYPAVLVQVKTTRALRGPCDGSYSYDLDVATHDVLRRIDHSIRRILVVIGLPEDGESVQTPSKGTLLVGRGLWVSLEGDPPSDNKTTQTIRLPEANTLDRAGLERMLMSHGIRRSTKVQNADPWEKT